MSLSFTPSRKLRWRYIVHCRSTGLDCVEVLACKATFATGPRGEGLKSLRTVAALRNLRSQSLWRLLAADKSPVILAILQTLLLDNEKTLSSSILKERLTREIEQLRAG